MNNIPFVPARYVKRRGEKRNWHTITINLDVEQDADLLHWLYRDENSRAVSSILRAWIREMWQQQQKGGE